MKPPSSPIGSSSLVIAWVWVVIAAAADSSSPRNGGAAADPLGALKKGSSAILDALGRWRKGAAVVAPYDFKSSSVSHKKVLLHLMDPGYADEDREGYEFYSYEFHNNNKNQEVTEGGTSTTPSRSLVLDEMIPSTNTCAEDGTCSLLVDPAGDEREGVDADEESAAQESSYVERAASPGGDDDQTPESDAPVRVPVKLDDAEELEEEDEEEGDFDDDIRAPSVSYSAAELEVGADLGVPQTVPDDNVRERMVASRTYLRDVVSDPANDPKYDKVRSICHNKHESCTYWAVSGECQANPAYMLINCAPACESCEMLHIDTRCPMDPNPVNAWKPGDLNAMFERIATDPRYGPYQPTVLSRPTYAPGDTNETAPYKIGLWMIQFDNAVSNEEADHLRELGEKQGYERSSDVGEEQPDGTYTAYVNEKRTSTNSWCTGDCYADPVARRIMDRIAHITGIPEPNSENLQMLRYDANQFYKTHNDYIPHQKERQAGVRIATFYMYLNDVEEGGETNFPRNHNLSVTPQKGRAVLWPSVHDSDPHERDRRSDHQAMPVRRGIKYGANAWIHQRDFKGPNGRGC